MPFNLGANSSPEAPLVARVNRPLYGLPGCPGLWALRAMELRPHLGLLPKSEQATECPHACVALRGRALLSHLSCHSDTVEQGFPGTARAQALKIAAQHTYDLQSSAGSRGRGLLARRPGWGRSPLPRALSPARRLSSMSSSASSNQGSTALSQHNLSLPLRNVHEN